MPNVTMGNVSVVEPWKPDEGSTEQRLRARPDLGLQETNFFLPPENPEDTVNPVTGQRDGFDFGQWITTVQSMWQMHSDAPPAWVESDHDGLAEVLSQIYSCPKGRPDDWRRGTDYATKSPERIDHKKKRS